MKKKILFFLIFLMSFTLKVYADTAPTIKNANVIGDDLVLVSTTKGTNNIATIFVNTTVNAQTATAYTPTDGIAYISLPNGTYYIWAVDVKGNQSQPYPITITTSCNLAPIEGESGSGKVDMCGTLDSNGNYQNITKDVPAVVCKDGYYLGLMGTQTTYSNCRPGALKFNGISKRFCKNTVEYTCQKSQNLQPSVSNILTSLSLSSGSLSPKFNSNTYEYTATVNASSVTINATAANGVSFVDGYGPRNVALNYGVNNVSIKIKGTEEKTYTIKITRPNNQGSGGNITPIKSTVNTLSSLSVSNGNLSPAFNPNTNDYEVNVDENIDTITIDSKLTNAKSVYLSGFEPRTIHLDYGKNAAYIKVKSESGSIRVYKITIIRAQKEEPVDPPVIPSSEALLSSLTLDSGNIDFETNVFDYNVTVDSTINNVVATVTPKNETDTIEINGGTNLVEGANELTIKVVSADGSVTNVYTIYIIKKADNNISDDSLLKNITIKNHKIKFNANTKEYSITLNQNETELDLEVEPSSEKASVTIEGNDKLTSGSEIKIRVTAESGNYTDYYLKITGYKKSGNVFLTIVLILIIGLLVAYAVLRILGYKIYFNLEAIKNSISNLFTKK